MGSSAGWEVVLPERGRAARGGRRPLARVVPARGGEGTSDGEGLLVAVPVGRRLAKRLSAKGAPELTREELVLLIERETVSCARERAAALVNRRDYSRKELAEKLCAEGFPKDTAASTAAWASEVGLVDDRRFAASFARSKALAGWGRVRIERELERRGVSLEGALDEDDDLLDDKAELERARALARRRVRGDRTDYARVMRFLGAKGYPFGLCCEVARELASGEDD